jgi:hypothetical protein
LGNWFAFEVCIKQVIQFEFQCEDSIALVFDVFNVVIKIDFYFFQLGLCSDLNLIAM